ncbi:MAG: hypothetical protein WB998_04580 [Solirubrobacteraceae bacterium]
MSVSTEVQRTLVKSPPELWTELSNPEALARHLGDFGEIRIVNTEPETKVEWEAEQAIGTVQLKQSGWGTKVTLSVTRSPAVPSEAPEAAAEAVVAEPEAVVAEPEAVVAEPEAVVAEPEPEPAPTLVAGAEPVVEPVAIEPEPVATEPDPVASEPQPIAPDPEPQPGFFARLFRKRRAKQAVIAASEPNVTAHADLEAETKCATVPEPEIEVVALAAPEPLYPDPPAQPRASEPAEDLASELESLEEQIVAETTELLTGVLDRLGAAHHRPFSRG